MVIRELFKIVRLMFTKPDKAIKLIDKKKDPKFLIYVFIFSIVVLISLFLLTYRTIIPSLLENEIYGIQINLTPFNFLVVIFVLVLTLISVYYLFALTMYLLIKLTTDTIKFKKILVSSNLLSLEVIITLILTVLGLFINNYVGIVIFVLGMLYYIFLLYKYMKTKIKLDNFTLFFLSIITTIVFITVILIIFTSII